MDYDEIADDYDRRYELHDYPGIRSTILSAIEHVGGGRALEVGCGTGTWLAELARGGFDVAGIDPSERMLLRASRRVTGDLRTGVAEDLPWDDGVFDAVLYINSLHHVGAPEAAMREAFRVLRRGGTVVSIGLDPHESGDRWYVYDFFPEALALDLKRFASRDRRLEWMSAAGFVDVAVRVAEHVQFSTTLDDAVRDGVLEQSFTSQLTALSSAEYAAGMRRLKAAAALDHALRLEVSLSLYATQARKPL